MKGMGLIGRSRFPIGPTFSYLFLANDDVYMKLVVDGQKVQRWPDRGQCGMGIGGDAFPNLQLSFSE